MRQHQYSSKKRYGLGEAVRRQGEGHQSSEVRDDYHGIFRRPREYRYFPQSSWTAKNCNASLKTDLLFGRI